MPDESALHIGRIVWISQTSSGLRSVPIHDFLTAGMNPATAPSTTAATASPHPHASMRNWTIAPPAAVGNASLAFLRILSA